MNINEKQVKEYITNIFGIDSPTGFTHKMIEYLQEEAKSMGYETSISPKGNLLIEVKGEDHSFKRATSAHADTLGLMVRSIKGNGALAFTRIGGPILPTLDSEYCRVYTRDGRVYTGTILSTSPAAHVHKDASTAPRNEDTMEVRIDEVVKSKEDVEKLGISAGDFICIDTKTTICDSGYVKTRFIDDKMSVVILFTLLRHYFETGEKPKYDTTFIITVFEEVGHGLAHLPSDIQEVIAVDMGCIGLDLNCTEHDVSICAKDSSGPYDYHIVSKMIELAKKLELPYAVDIYPMYGSDCSAALSGGNNIRGGLIGTGVYASHGMERTHLDGVKASIKLLHAYLGQ
ncbi:MAG: M42 family metallopeptidase [Erysipelotrichaceae bacterium]|nr:M42 family metallopeptidase [Erysipelotrichaceae bacterium]MBR3694002.1 M42 family metallopeptidase [Erysipelotrichales bacterium]